MINGIILFVLLLCAGIFIAWFIKKYQSSKGLYKLIFFLLILAVGIFAIVIYSVFENGEYGVISQRFTDYGIITYVVLIVGYLVLEDIKHAIQRDKERK